MFCSCYWYTTTSFCPHDYHSLFEPYHELEGTWLGKPNHLGVTSPERVLFRVRLKPIRIIRTWKFRARINFRENQVNKCVFRGSTWSTKGRVVQRLSPQQLATFSEQFQRLSPHTRHQGRADLKRPSLSFKSNPTKSKNPRNRNSLQCECEKANFYVVKSSSQRRP